MLNLEYMTWWQAALLYAALAAPVVYLGWRSLAGLGPVRRWVAVAARLLVLLLAVLVVAGARFERQNKAVEVIVLRDVSASTDLVRDYPGQTLRDSVNDYLQKSIETEEKEPDDKVGVISFDAQANVDAIPNTGLVLNTQPVRRGQGGSNPAEAVQLALATLDASAMHRLLLVWDGNATAGDLDGAVRAAKAQGVPIDVMPLAYDVGSEVLVERFVAPAWKRENEPFSVDVILRSTNAVDVTGELQVLHQGQPMEVSPGSADPRVRTVTLRPGRNVERVQVPALPEGGVHQFKAIFTAPNVTVQASGASAAPLADVAGVRAGDTLIQNNTADAFTFVRGQGRVLFVDNAVGDAGQTLRAALAAEKIEIDPDRVGVDAFPTSLVDLQNYDAVVLVNVPRGAGGLSDGQQEALANYVHDLGGGLVMVGGPDAFGAGGWQGSKLEEVLPVNMDIPAQRQIPKGALALVLHSCEMPDGNYWGIQCGIKAAEVLNARDEIGVLSFDWAGGGAAWDYPLSEKGDGTRVTGAIKGAQLGDMPSFDDTLNLALNGGKGSPGLVDSDARQKHIIIISDGDPAPPNPAIVQGLRDNKITVSTVQVAGHGQGLMPVMQGLAQQTGGRSYGPIEDNPNQLPQIFIKEATVVRRSLIFEDLKNGIPVKGTLSASDLVSGIDTVPAVYGMVLTSRKPDPQVEVPLTAGKNDDPILASWQTGLGRSAAFTSDASARWAAQWVASPLFQKFWAQVVRGVSRPPESTDFDVRVTAEGGKGKIVVEAVDENNAFKSFLTIRGGVVGPGGEPQDVRLVQTAPGVYEGDFDADEPGNYVAGLSYTGANNYGGVLRSGTAVNASPELRELRSDAAALRNVAEATGGRVLRPFDPLDQGGLFTRAGLAVSRSPLPIWDILLPVLLGLLIVDVAVRRIAWDRSMATRVGAAVGERVRDLTGGRRTDQPAGGALDALRRVRTDTAEEFKRAGTDVKPGATPARPAAPVRDRTRKFDAADAPEGDLAAVVGGATDKPLPAAKQAKEPPKGEQPEKPGGMGSLMEAKRRAREQMERQKNDQ